MYSYDFPLSPKARTYLKFENIFKRSDFQVSDKNHDLNAEPYVMYILRAIVDYIDLCDGSSSIKIELLKDLERCHARLNEWIKNPESDSEAIESLIAQIKSARNSLDGFTRQRTVLKDDNLLESVKQRFFSPSGVNCFDTPMFEFWMHLPIEERENTILKWLRELDCLRIPVLTVLYLWRLCAEYQNRVATCGFMQENADTCDIINIQYAKDIRGYPVVSGFQSRINVRFLPFDKGATVGDIDFKIAYIKSSLQ